MPISIRIKRGTGGPPTSLLRGELAYYEDQQRLYIGSGDSGADDANGLPIAQNVVELTTPPFVLADLADISVGSGASDGDVLVYDSATSDWVAEALSIAWEDVTSKPATFAPSTHASSHHTGGGDAIAPADIGAAAATHSHAAADITSGTLDIARIPTGSTSSTVCIGDDARLTNNRDPNSHTHGNITNAGAIGSTSGLPIKTGTSGVLEAGAFGTSAGQFAEGNHSHAWDDITSKPSTFTPAAHNHTVTLEISGLIESPEAKTYVLSPSIPAAITITNVKAKTSAGTVDIKLQDDGVDISDTTIGDVGTSVASPATEPSATVASGSVLALVVSDLQSSPADLAFSVHYTVASANNA